MSNPTTGYICTAPPYAGGTIQDLSAIFLPLSQGTGINFDTSFNVTGYGDLRNIFSGLVVGSNPLGYNTNYTVTGYGDLQNIFAPYNTQLYYHNSTTSITDSHSGLTINFNDFAFSSQIATNNTGQYITIPGAYNYSKYNSQNPGYGGVIMSNNFGYSFILYYPDNNYCPTAYPTSWTSCSTSYVGDIILTGNSGGQIWKSTNYGSVWSQLPNWTSIGGGVSCLTSDYTCTYNYAFISFPGGPGPIIAFDTNGNILHNTGTPYFNANKIFTNSTGQYVYFTTNYVSRYYTGGVMYSSNYGSSYSLATTPLTSGTGNWIAIDCDKTGKYVYASEATTNSLYYSTNYGVSFSLLNTVDAISGSSNAMAINGITCDKTGNILTIATFPNSSGSHGGIYQSKTILTNIIAGTPTNATWAVIGTSASQSNTFWTSISSDINTGLILSMGVAVAANNISSGGLYTYNYYP
jgi:hypothetical protein